MNNVCIRWMSNLCIMYINKQRLCQVCDDGTVHKTCRSLYVRVRVQFTKIFFFLRHSLGNANYEKKNLVIRSQTPWCFSQVYNYSILVPFHCIMYKKFLQVKNENVLSCNLLLGGGVWVNHLARPFLFFGSIQGKSLRPDCLYILYTNTPFLKSF